VSGRVTSGEDWSDGGLVPMVWLIVEVEVSETCCADSGTACRTRVVRGPAPGLLSVTVTGGMATVTAAEGAAPAPAAGAAAGAGAGPEQARRVPQASTAPATLAVLPVLRCVHTVPTVVAASALGHWCPARCPNEVTPR